MVLLSFGFFVRSGLNRLVSAGDCSAGYGWAAQGMNDTGYHWGCLRSATQCSITTIFIGGIDIRTGCHPVDHRTAPIRIGIASARAGSTPYGKDFGAVDATR